MFPAFGMTESMDNANLDGKERNKMVFKRRRIVGKIDVIITQILDSHIPFFSFALMHHIFHPMLLGHQL